MAVRKPKAPVSEQQSSGKWDASRVGVYAENLAHAYRTSGTVARNLGHQFYPSWHDDAQHFGQRSGTSTEHGAVALARFSPQTHEALNRMQALQLLHVPDSAEHHLRTALESSQLAGATRRDLIASGVHPDVAKHDEEVRMHQHAAWQARGRAGIHGTPLNHQSSDTLLTALAVRNNEHPHPLSQLEGKIGDYAGAIHDPRGYQRIAGDTHIYHAAVGGGNHAIKYEDTDKLFAKKAKGGPNPVYEGLQDVHRLAYRQNIGQGHVDPDETSPNAHMGTIWFGHRDTKMDVNPRAAASAKARVTMMRGYLAHPLGAQWDPARNGLRPVAF